MDWARDNTGLSEQDLKKVWKYEPKDTTVVQMLGSKGYRAEIWSLQTEGDWYDWIHKERPAMDGSDSGLTLLLAKRTGEPSIGGIAKASSDDWLERVNKKINKQSSVQRAQTFLSEKKQAAGGDAGSAPLRGQRSLRTLPFSMDTFKLITKSFYTHGSISRVVSRADVPIFSCEKVEMKHPAYIYNCRSTNAWELDLALSVTHLPHAGVTFAILFGCPFSTQEEIIKRLTLVTSEAAHPLLMPGIFAELERSRHVRIVESTVNEVEARIFELDFQSGDLEGPQGEEAERRNEAKRTAWLDMTYLRNALVSWDTQLGKMVRHADELREAVFQPASQKNKPNIPPRHCDFRTRISPQYSESAMVDIDVSELSGDPAHLGSHANPDGDVEGSLEEVKKPQLSQRRPDLDKRHGPEQIKDQMRVVGDKIRDRIQVIRDEYDDKIRDCTMRVDGMAMATQWSHGETNVEIALATNRDSQHMRSIALVTMIFLPGTFFASVFSMTFFNWSSDSGSPMVSGYLWIYVLVTVFFTLLTIGSWWYFVVWRQSRRRKADEEEEDILLPRI